ncbi:YihA family ribosome biogenesis GTP-binding protein [bacterium SCSIO 12643]|nr:YihA family ribosome biogenesis GTP-binding protein [bacterium SCSIO 12643]
MKVKNAKFVMSNSDYKKCPTPDLPEYAFIGRSNVGKSSLINALTNRKSLAKTSGKPGKTQLINHFMINDDWYLVDLPGYGYASVSKTKRAEFQVFLRAYLKNRENLMCTFVLLDSRLEPQKIDMEFMQWMGEQQIPFVMVFTKIDKLNSSQLSKNMRKYQSKMLNSWEALPKIFHTSSVTKFGSDDILKFVEQTNTLFKD